jgi:predicted transcriptional regulator
MSVEGIEYEPFREPGAPNNYELRILQDVVALTAELGQPPPLSRVGRDLGITKQGVYHWVKKMRKKGLVQEREGQCAKAGIVLTHNGLLAVASAMATEL